MRRLITDAQAKFRKMVEDQRQAVVGGASSSAGPPSASSSETAAEPADSLHSPQPPPTQAGLKAALDAEKGEPPPLQTPPPPHAAASASQPPPPPPRERKVPPVPVAVTSAVENGGDQPTEVQLVRPPSPAPGPSNKQPEVAGAAASSSTSPPPSETPCTTSLLTSTSSSSASSSKQQQLSVRLENERLRREVAELRRVLSAQGGVASSVVGGANAAVGGASALGGGANGLVGGSSSLVGGANGQVGGANLQEGGASALVGGASEADDGLLSDAEKVIVLESQLAQTKEALAAAKSDRKRLKAEKFDLLNQMKQLYATLEDKEKELRDFIRSFEQERCERERERWSLLRHARDEAERSLNLAAQLDIKDQQLIEARRQLSSACLSDGGGGGGGDNISLCRASLNGREGGVAPAPPHTPTTSSNLMIGGGDRGSCSADSGVRGSSDRESGATSATGGNLSDSTTDGAPTMNYESSSHYHQHQHSSASTNLTNANSTNIDPDTVSLMSSIATAASYQLTTPKDCNSPSLSPLNAHPFSRSLDTSNLSRSVEQLTSPPATFDHLLDHEQRAASVIAANSSHHRRSKERLSSRSCGLPRGTGGGGGGGGGPWGSISRVFARSRHRSKAPSPSSHDDSLSACGDPTYASIGERGGGGGRSWSPLTEEGYAEKLRLLREAGQVPMERWRAPTVLAWLEIALGMPQYGPRCAENVKSGKVLLELSDVELECGLGITHPMHRKKLRLAIEEHRQPGLVRYPPIAQLGHTWVSSEWLPDLGLAQYSENFAANMVDARMLDNLSKKELEKFLGVTRKFHQASIVHGIHLLRMMKYDRQALAVRRHQCETIDADPLVWTNQRFIRWARNIDLGEYADNLKDSGVHGALVVLEPSLGGDTMATALGIPPSRHMIRRHLTTELEALVLPARSSFERLTRERRRAERLVSEGGSLGRSFSRSYGAGLSRSSLVLEGGGGESPPPTPPPHQSEMQRQHYQQQQQLISNGGSNEKEKDKRRASLRSSLGRVLGLKSSTSTNHHHHHHHHHSSSSTSSLRVSDPCPLPSNYQHHFPYSSPPLNFPSNIPPPLPPPNNCSPSSPYHQPPPLLHPHFPSSPSPTYSSPPQLGGGGGGGGGCPTLSSSSPTTTLSSSDNVVAPTRQRRPHHRHRRVKSIGDINVTPI